MIIAHGPWWTEWHHLLPYLPILGPALVAWWAIWKERHKK